MDKIHYNEKHIEAKLSAIGAKVVKATEMSFSTTKLLQDVQMEIADLYESLGDVLSTTKLENEEGNKTIQNLATAIEE